MVDWKEIKANDRYEMKALVTEFKIYGYRNLGEISIKIWQYNNLAEPFCGECEYEFWGPEQFSPYSSSRPRETVEEAFNEALRGITNFDKLDKYPDDVVFFVREMNGERVYIDGSGSVVTKAEADKRREQFRKRHSVS